MCFFSMKMDVELQHHRMRMQGCWICSPPELLGRRRWIFRYLDILVFPSDPSRSSGHHHGWHADGHGTTDAHLYGNPNDTAVLTLLSRRCPASTFQQGSSPSFWLHDVHYGRSSGCILCIIGMQFEAEVRLARITMVSVV